MASPSLLTVFALLFKACLSFTVSFPKETRLIFKTLLSIKKTSALLPSIFITFTFSFLLIKVNKKTVFSFLSMLALGRFAILSIFLINLYGG